MWKYSLINPECLATVENCLLINSMKLGNFQMHQDLACLKHSCRAQQRAFMLLQSQAIAEEEEEKNHL
jgi:hypothetical protein